MGTTGHYRVPLFGANHAGAGRFYDTPTEHHELQEHYNDDDDSQRTKGHLHG